MHSKDNTFEWVFCFKTSSASLYFIEHFLAHFQDNHKSGFNIVGFMITFKRSDTYTCLLIFLDHYSSNIKFVNTVYPFEKYSKLTDQFYTDSDY